MCMRMSDVCMIMVVVIAMVVRIVTVISVCMAIVGSVIMDIYIYEYG